jgi:hypothetical protein
MDVGTIELGSDFAESINDSLSKCKVLIAVIGKHWLDMTTESGIARLSDRNDYVRMEIETALRRKIWVIPVLVENAAVPRSDELPESMAPLARRKYSVIPSLLARDEASLAWPATRRAERCWPPGR